MRVTYSCPEGDASGFNTRSEFLDHVKTHDESVVADVNKKIEAAQQILQEEKG
ncbi:MAG: hypothetical protein JWP02_1332 [Acidimicrobiales bacterium]|nr:hypothetical protein [Acidimicrobiales bacterium]